MNKDKNDNMVNLSKKAKRKANAARKRAQKSQERKKEEGADGEENKVDESEEEEERVAEELKMKREKLKTQQYGYVFASASFLLFDSKMVMEQGRKNLFMHDFEDIDNQLVCQTQNFYNQKGLDHFANRHQQLSFRLPEYSVQIVSCFNEKESK
jgi:hypothetical protein